MVPGPPAAPGGAGDRLRAQGRRLGISGEDLPGGGGPGARESAARGRDLSGANPALHSAAAPRMFCMMSGKLTLPHIPDHLPKTKVVGLIPLSNSSSRSFLLFNL